MAEVNSTNTWSERFVDVDGARLRYFERGQSRDHQPVVYLADGSGDPELNRAHELVAAQRRVLVLEMARPQSAPAPVEAARRIERMLGALGLEQVDVWGAGLGGEVAAWLAIQDPERVGAVVLEAPSGVSLHAPAEDGSPLEHELGSLRVPVLVVFGTEDDVIAPETGRVYKSQIPTCHLVYVYDAGHHPSSERPEAFVEVALDFIERREQFVVGRGNTALFP